MKIAVAVVAIVLAAAFMFAALAHSYATPRIVSGDVGAEGNPPYSTARGMCTMEVTTGRVLYEKNAHARMPMASTTKIATAITVIEHVADLDEIVKVNDKAIGIEGTSIYIQKGEELTVRELVYGLMLRSGNDCSVALALHVSKTVPEFSALMNDMARRVGAINTNFTNPHGLDEAEHYTTAYDLALISAYAMRDPVFAEIVATKEKRISGVEYPRVLLNKNRLLRSNADIVGVKTGFTSKAGRCFVGGLRDSGMTVICAVLNCGPMFPESEMLMERATDEFYMHRVLATETIIAPTVPCECDPKAKRKCTELRGMVEEDFHYPIRQCEVDKLQIKMDKDFIRVLFDGKEVHKTEYIKIDKD